MTAEKGDVEWLRGELARLGVLGCHPEKFVGALTVTMHVAGLLFKRSGGILYDAAYYSYDSVEIKRILLPM